MAEPGDPFHPDHDDDAIGFASPASLQGRARGGENAQPPLAPPTVRPEVTPAVARPPVPAPDADADLFATPPGAAQAAWSEPVAAVPPAAPSESPAHGPVEGDAVLRRAPESEPRRRRRDGAADLPNEGMGLYAIYALILFAVPTVGVSAAIGLLAVTRRDPPPGVLASSHFIYQKRTLQAAAVAALAGLVLLALPFALGVPVLFLLALWVVLRGASGVWLLKSGQPIANPRGWWI